MGRDLELLSKLIKSSSEAALGTLEEDSSGTVARPYLSATGYVVEDEEKLSVAVFLSKLARHTRNIQKNPRVSLLVVETGRDPVHQRARATLMGKAVMVRDEEAAGHLKREYLKRFPKAEIFFSLADFSFYRIEPSEIHWIAGFGKAGTFVFSGEIWQPRSS